MNKTTRIAGIDNKYGRKSRTGSTISMNISDMEAMECQQYLMAIEAGEEPSGRIKKIELVMYGDDDLRNEPDIIQSMNMLDAGLSTHVNKDDEVGFSSIPTIDKDKDDAAHVIAVDRGYKEKDDRYRELKGLPTHEGNQRDLDIYDN